MDSHYHLLIHTPEGNLQRAMRHLNRDYTQSYKAILLEPDAYLLTHYKAT